MIIIFNKPQTVSPSSFIAEKQYRPMNGLKYMCIFVGFRQMPIYLRYIDH